MRLSLRLSLEVHCDLVDSERPSTSSIKKPCPLVAFATPLPGQVPKKRKFEAEESIREPGLLVTKKVAGEKVWVECKDLSPHLLTSVEARQLPQAFLSFLAVNWEDCKASLKEAG